MSSRPELRLLDDPDPDPDPEREGPTDEGRRLIAAARDRLRRAPDPWPAAPQPWLNETEDT